MSIAVGTTLTSLGTFGCANKEQMLFQVQVSDVALSGFEIHIRPERGAAYQLYINDSASFLNPSGRLVEVGGPSGFTPSYDMTTMGVGDIAGFTLDVIGIDSVELFAKTAAGTSNVTVFNSKTE